MRKFLPTKAEKEKAPRPKDEKPPSLKKRFARLMSKDGMTKGKELSAGLTHISFVGMLFFCSVLPLAMLLLATSLPISSMLSCIDWCSNVVGDRERLAKTEQDAPAETVESKPEPKTPEEAKAEEIEVTTTSTAEITESETADIEQENLSPGMNRTLTPV